MKPIEFTPKPSPLRIGRPSRLSSRIIDLAKLMPSISRLPFLLFVCLSVFPARAAGTSTDGASQVVNLPAAPVVVTPEDPPTVASFFPESGPIGSSVTIFGDHLATATAVKFSGVGTSFQAGLDGTSLIAAVPADASTGPITVVTPSGSFTTSSSFTVTALASPVITGFSPDRGPVGTSVTITGNNLAGVTRVRFNGTDASFTLFGTSITAMVPQSATTGLITVLSDTASSSSDRAFTVVGPGAPVITSLVPESGRPGALITINGANLGSVTGVAFTGVTAQFYLFGSSIFATVPDGIGSGFVTVASPQGNATSPKPFTVLNALAPEITGFTPESGAAGVSVSITGTNLASAIAVRFGPASAAITAVSNTAIQASVPPDALTGPITVVTPDGTAASKDTFYVAGRIDSFAPNHGPVGTPVTIRGPNLTGTLAVLFNGVSAPFTNISASELRTVVPEGAPSGAITIATPAGFANTATAFYLPPTISSMDPTSGFASSNVTITGENLVDISSVRFGGLDAVFTPLTPVSLSAIVPQNAVTGPITITTPGGVATSSGPFLVGQYAELEISLAVVPDTGGIGDLLNYAVTVTNRGLLQAQNIVVVDRLPDGVRTVFGASGASCTEANNIITCSVPQLAAGGDFAIHIPVTIVDGPYLTNQVTVTSSSADPYPANNTVSLVTPLKGAPPLDDDVVLTATLSDGILVLSWPASAAGMILETATNLGPAAAWKTVTTPPTTINGANVVHQSTDGPRSFYRLRKP